MRFLLQSDWAEAFANGEKAWCTLKRHGPNGLRQIARGPQNIEPENFVILCVCIDIAKCMY